ncbi:MAG: AAA family ATPase [Acidobacteriota bacterium]
MLVSRLKLKNWRNFRHIDIGLAPRVFVIGPNAAGKSNLLDSLRFLRDVAKPGGGLQQAISQRGGLSKVRCLSARREPDVEIEVDLKNGDGIHSHWRYAIGITQQVRGYRQPILRYEKVWSNGRLILDRPDTDDRKDEERMTQTHLEQISANVNFREIGRFFESIRYLHLVPQLLRHPEAFQGSGVPEDPYGRNFLELVAKTPEKTRKARLKKIELALREAVPNLKDLTDTKDESGVPHLEALYEHWRPNAGRQREDQFSDGTLRLIAMLWLLLEGDAPLLLEEPELSLHSQIVKLIPRLIFRVQRRSKRQILVSTHSWELLSDKGIGGEEVVELKPDQEGTKATLLSGDADVRRLLESGLSIADVAIPRTSPATLDQLSLSFE